MSYYCCFVASVIQGAKMIDSSQFQPQTLELLNKLRTERYETITYMQKFGTAFEKAIAAVVLEAAGGRE